MSSRTCYLGLDTSNYATSLAIVDAGGQLVSQITRVLAVKDGERGLRQGEAFYQHVNNLPELVEELPDEALNASSGVICVSEQPRPVLDSYMPVFKAGIACARTIAKAKNWPLIRVSHQENHLRAALYGAGMTPEEMPDVFLGVHFSGGTSEILRVKRVGWRYETDILGESLDLKAGQLIDRVGVALGFSFPAGKELEQLALGAITQASTIPSTIDGWNFHFSGQENKARQELEEGLAPSEVAFGVIRCVGKTLTKVLTKITAETQIRTILFFGGVMGNGIIKGMLGEALPDCELHFAPPAYSSDNAVGNAFLAYDYQNQEARDD